MDAQDKMDALYAYTRKQEAMYARLQPASEQEERLVRQLALCSYRLEQIESRLTQAWSQLNKIAEELKHDLAW
ncbi:MAG: hypothetical protein KatS3mg131_0777 [Candidatus Tectimicrobiota bacterium]|nr:MAG: hypothetical protein KatS3mg131_0777 [Candidatus Tectomicrobia bacterium]